MPQGHYCVHIKMSLGLFYFYPGVIALISWMNFFGLGGFERRDTRDDIGIFHGLHAQVIIALHIDPHLWRGAGELADPKRHSRGNILLLGKDIVEGKVGLKELEKYALEHDNFKMESGRQEMLESIVNRTLFGK